MGSLEISLAIVAVFASFGWGFTAAALRRAQSNVDWIEDRHANAIRALSKVQVKLATAAGVWHSLESLPTKPRKGQDFKAILRQRADRKHALNELFN